MKSPDLLPADRFGELPGPLHDLLRQLDGEPKPFRKVHRLIDTVEWAVKWHAVVAVADLLRAAAVPPAVRVLLASGLRTPSLGLWNLFFREALGALEAPAAPWSAWERLTRLENRYHLVALRNRYAHGATPSDANCLADVERYRPVLLQLIGSPLFTDVGLVVVEGGRVVRLRGAEREEVPGQQEVLEPGHAGALLPDGTVLDLWPLGLWKEDPESAQRHFFFYNALRNKKIEQLNYELPRLRRDKALWEPFHERLPLKEWARVRDADLEAFRDRVEALTEGFVGRREEREELRAFCTEGEGTLMVWGPPGIGKSALLAQAFKELRAGVDADGRPLAGSLPVLVEYFIRRNEGRDDPVRFLRYLCRRLDEAHGLRGHGLGETAVQLQEQLEARLQAVDEAAEEETPLRTVLFVDGLDEGTEIARIIPAARRWLPVVVASRRVPEAEAFYEGRERERRRATEVGPLRAAEVRALLYGVVDKYDPELDGAYVEAVTARSEGNPLYLRLLAEELFQGARAVGDVASLPREVGDLYTTTVDRRIGAGEGGEDALAVLYLLAEARSALTAGALAELAAERLGRSAARARRALDRCAEVLFEDPSTPEVEDYQLFHESLREWLRAHHASECAWAGKRLAGAAEEWEALRDREARAYVLGYGVEHVRAEGDAEALWALLRDEGYRRAQVAELGRHREVLGALEAGMEFFAQREGENPEDDARLCWLVLRLGEAAEVVRAGVPAVLHLVRTGDLDGPVALGRALEQLEGLDEETYFGAYLALLLVVADRAGRGEVSREAAGKRVHQITEALHTKVPHASYEENLVAAVIGLVARRVSLAMPLRLYPWLESRDRYVEELCKTLEVSCTDTRAVSFIRVEAEAVVSAPSEEWDYDRANALTKVAVALVGAGQAEAALEVAHSVEGYPKREVLEKVAVAFAGTGRVEAALEVARSVEGDDSRAFTLMNVATALAKMGRDEAALAAARYVEGYSERAEALLIVAVALAEAGQAETASSALGEALEVARSLEGYSFLARALSEVAEALVGVEQFKAALVAARSVEGGYSRAQALVTVAVALAEAGQVEAALEVAHSVEGYPKREVLEKVAAALAEAGRVEAALEVARSVEGDDPRAETQMNLAVVFAGADRVEAALEVARSLERSDSRDEAWRKVATTLVGAGQFEAALAAARSVEGGYSRAQALVTVAEALAEAGRVEAALEVAHSVEGYSRARALEKVAAALAEAGRVEAALAAARSVEEKDSRAQALVTVAATLAEVGQGEAASSALGEALEVARSLERGIYRTIALEGVAKTLVGTGRVEAALAAARSVAWDDSRARALVTVAAALAEVGQGEAASSALEEALAAARSVERDVSRAVALEKVAAALATASRKEEAADLMLEAAGTPLLAGDGLSDCSLSSRLTRLQHAWEASGALPYQDKASPKLLVACLAGGTAFPHSPLASLTASEESWTHLLKGQLELLAPWDAPVRASLRHVLRYFARCPSAAPMGAFLFTLALARQGELDVVNAVASACPQLGLSDFVRGLAGEKAIWNPAVLPTTLLPAYEAQRRLLEQGVLTEEQFVQVVGPLFDVAGSA